MKLWLAWLVGQIILVCVAVVGAVLYGLGLAPWFAWVIVYTGGASIVFAAVLGVYLVVNRDWPERV